MKSKFLIIILFIASFLINPIYSKSQLTKWKSNVSLSNIEFEKIRYKIIEKDTVAVIGYLKNETIIDGYPCEADLVHLSIDMKPIYFKLAKPYKLENTEIAVGTWISLERAGYYICSLPEDQTIQGYLCMGSNGQKGPKVTFDKDGKLRSFYSPTDLKIGQIYCSGGKSNEIGLLKNGAISFCTLSIDHNINDVKYKAGLILTFDFNGNVAFVKEK